MKIKNISDIIFVKELDLEVRLYTNKKKKKKRPSCLISLLFWGGGGFFFFLFLAVSVVYA